MKIKKHPTGNEYVYAGGVWVRNFTKEMSTPMQLTHLFDKSDYSIIMQNEELNKNHPKISDEKIFFNKVVIVSDGYDFENRHKFLAKLPRDVGILAVNEALRKWTLMHHSLPPEQRRSINAYVINNPYQEAMRFMPPKDNKYYPVCIASIRTNSKFTENYLGDVYSYVPTVEMKFGTIQPEEYYVDDYRNPICAAIDLAYRFKATKIMLLCCDGSFEEERDYAVKLENGLWTYPQHLKSHSIIDAKLHWLTTQEDKEVSVANYSSGPDCSNAVYISCDNDALDFFRDQEEGTKQ